MTLSDKLHELKTLIESQHALIVLETTEEERAQRLVAAASKSLGLSFYEWAIGSGLRHASAQDLGGTGIAATFEPAQMLRHVASLDRAGLYLLKDFQPHLDDPAVQRALREVCQAFTRTRSSVILTGDDIALPAPLAAQAVPLEIALPDEREIRQIVESVIESLSRHRALEVELSAEDHASLVDALRGMTANQVRQSLAYVAIEDGRLTREDIERVVDRKARWIQDSGLLEYFPPRDAGLELGGFGRLKAWLDRARSGFSPEAAAIGLAPPRGLLIVGVQGCGKSLAAKVIAQRWRQPLLKLDAGRLYDKFVGESDKNLRRALALAESVAPAILWIDEIEKAFGVSGDENADGGLSRRIQGHLLTWLQEKHASVFVVATANDVFALPPELMRKGRFDEVFFVDLPNPAERRAIFEIHLRARRQDPSPLGLDDLVFASEGMSGAEIEQAVVAALYRSLHERRALSRELVLAVLDATIPLSESRREDVDRLRKLAGERFLRAS
ncbi:MAG: AAA family ATPase [Myxococcota bacterium]